MNNMRTLTLLMLASGSLLLTACRIPLSKIPLSDETNSRVDERLIGTWEIDVRRVQEILGNKDSEPTARYRLERAKDHKNTLLCTYVNEGGEDDKPLPCFTTHLGMHDYLSLASRGVDSEFYVICRYEVEGEDEGKLFLMSSEFVVEQIDSGKVTGKVDRDGDEIRGVMLGLKPDELREFILRHSDKAFDLEHPLACKRIVDSVPKE